MTGPAMAMSSRSLPPEDWLTAVSRDAARTPPAAARVEPRMNTIMRTLSILIPARRAAKLDPVQALSKR